MIVFGDAGTLSYTPAVAQGVTSIEAASLVSVGVYSESPTDAQRDDDDNALAAAVQHVTTWTDGKGENQKVIALAAITDTDPTSSQEYEVYYAVWRYRLEAAAQIQRDIEPFQIYRVEGASTDWGARTLDITSVEGKLSRLFSMAELTEKLIIAGRLVGNDLRTRGLRLDQVQKEDCRDLVRYKALVLCCTDKTNLPNDEWWMKSERYEKFYYGLIESLPIGVDTDGDGITESRPLGGSAVYIFR